MKPIYKSKFDFFIVLFVNICISPIIVYSIISCHVDLILMWTLLSLVVVIIVNLLFIYLLSRYLVMIDGGLIIVNPLKKFFTRNYFQAVPFDSIIELAYNNTGAPSSFPSISLKFKKNNKKIIKLKFLSGSLNNVKLLFDELRKKNVNLRVNSVRSKDYEDLNF